MRAEKLSRVRYRVYHEWSTLDGYESNSGCIVEDVRIYLDDVGNLGLKTMSGSRFEDPGLLTHIIRHKE